MKAAYFVISGWKRIGYLNLASVWILNAHAVKRRLKITISDTVHFYIRSNSDSSAELSQTSSLGPTFEIILDFSLCRLIIALSHDNIWQNPQLDSTDSLIHMELFLFALSLEFWLTEVGKKELLKIKSCKMYTKGKKTTKKSEAIFLQL